MEAENLGQDVTSPGYWLIRAAFCEQKEKILDIEEHNRVSRSGTPEVHYPDLFGTTDLDQAMGYAENVAGVLGILPAGRVLLDGEVHEESTQDLVYWRRKTKNYRYT